MRAPPPCAKKMRAAQNRMLRCRTPTGAIITRTHCVRRTSVLEETLPSATCRGTNHGRYGNEHKHATRLGAQTTNCARLSRVRTALGDPSKRCCLAHDAGQPHALDKKIASASAPSSTAADDRTQHPALTALRPQPLKDWPPGRRRHCFWDAAVPPAQHETPPYGPPKKSRSTHILVESD